MGSIPDSSGVREESGTETTAGPPNATGLSVPLNALATRPQCTAQTTGTYARTECETKN